MKTNAKSGENFEIMANSLINVFSISYLINPSKRYEDVYELLKKSANAYKLENSWEKAGNVYVKAAQYISSNPSDGLFSVSSNFESIECYTNAAFCYDKIKHPNRFKCRISAIKIYKNSGKFDRAGKLHKEIANIYEQEQELVKAREQYTKAMECFDLDNKSKSESIKCLCKIAELFLLEGNEEWQVLEEMYNKIIDYYQTQNLGKFIIKQYIMMAMLTIMVLSTVEEIKTKLEKYCTKDYDFTSGLQGKFIDSIISSIENNDVNLFEFKCFEYNQVKPLDNQMVTILSAIKKQIINCADRTPLEFNELGEIVPGIDDEVDLC
jgi:tetratricopeptide (TPR) repeat protein